MTTQKQIDEQIAKEGLAFMNKVFDYAIPQGFMRVFRRAVMSVPQSVAKINIAYLKKLGDKKEDELTHGDVHMMMSIIHDVKPADMYDTWDEYIDHAPLVQEMGVVLKKVLDDQQEKLIKVRNIRSNLAGITGSSAPFNTGLKMAQA